MCGYDLRKQTQDNRRLSWVDLLLVVAVVAVLAFWWQLGTQNVTSPTEVVQAILPTSIPLLAATITPTPTNTPVPTATAIPVQEQIRLVRHEVVSGETLLSLAITYDVSVEEIQRANNLSSELIRAGDTLNIPIPQDSTAAQLQAAVTDFQYVVRPGDTLSTIAIQLGSSVDSIQSANQLAAGQFIQPGDVLVIPVVGAPVEALDLTPSPSASPPPSYSQMELRLPQQGASLARDEPVTLEWSGVAELASNEWYLLQLLPRNLVAQNLPTFWVKQSRYSLDSALAPPEGQAAEYAWIVSVVRVNRTEDGGALLEAASPASAGRTFSWK